MDSITYRPGGTQLGNVAYSYDADGRVTAKGGSLAATGMPSSVSGNTFNADNEMTQFGSQSLTYDNNGNLTSDGTNTYTWDARNHLTAISGGVSASFVYDAFGRRTNKTIGNTTTQFVYDALNPVQELNGSNSVVANLLTGMRIDEYFTRTASSTTSAFLADALGSTIGLVTANNGPIATSYTYQPFGATTASGASNTNSYEFAGRENDGTGLYYYRARYYSPSFQTFIAQDPLDFGGGDANLYEYVHSGPTYSRDPSGQGLVGAFVGLGVGGFFGVVGTYAGSPSASGWQAIRNGAIGAVLGFGEGLVEPGPVGVGVIAFVGDVGAQYIQAGSVDWVQALGAGVAAAVGAGLTGQIFTSEGRIDEGLAEAYTDVFGGMGALLGNGVAGFRFGSLGSGSGRRGRGCP